MLQLTRATRALDPARWNAFYDSLGIDPSRQGLLPFRVWQLFDLTRAALQRNASAEFIAAAGVLAHYVGDACQPLHASYLHDGHPETGRGRGVHSAYEATLIERYSSELSLAIATSQVKRPKPVRDGHAAARAALNLMRRSLQSIPPSELIDVYERSHHSISALWSHFGDRTALRLLDGATVLAVLWESAWANAPGNDVRAVTTSELRRFYLDERWAPSVRLNQMHVEGSELKVSTVSARD